ncbi:MAG: hypothetical protein V3V04_04770 [Rhizobiaceae bacterium]
MGKAVTLIIDLTCYFAIVYFLGDFVEKGSIKYIIILIGLVSVYHFLRQAVLRGLAARRQPPT